MEGGLNPHLSPVLEYSKSTPLQWTDTCQELEVSYDVSKFYELVSSCYFPD